MLRLTSEVAAAWNHLASNIADSVIVGISDGAVGVALDSLDPESRETLESEIKDIIGDYLHSFKAEHIAQTPQPSPHSQATRIVDAILMEMKSDYDLNRDLNDMDPVVKENMVNTWTSLIDKINDEYAQAASATQTQIAVRYQNHPKSFDDYKVDKNPEVSRNFASLNQNSFLERVSEVVTDTLETYPTARDAVLDVVEGVMEVIDGTGYPEGGYLLIPPYPVNPTTEQVAEHLANTDTGIHTLLSIDVGLSDNYRTNIAHLRRGLNTN